LAAMLLPALDQSKKKAQGILCLSNLRQVSLGWQLYTDDHDNRYPPNASTGATWPAVGVDKVNPSWVGGVLGSTARPDNTNAQTLVGADYAAFGSIGQYVRHAGVYRCPADVSTDPGSGQARVRSISMNGWVNPGKVNQHDSAYWSLPFQKFARPTGIGRASPSEIFVLLDERYQSINDGWLYVSVEGYNRDGSVNAGALNVYDLPAVYHNKASAFSFADGHCALRRWQGGIILNDTDLVWLMTHATVPQ